MLQCHVELCLIEINVAHKVRRYIQLFVASEPISDVFGFILTRTHVASMNNKLTRIRRISAFLPPTSCGVSSEGFL